MKELAKVMKEPAKVKHMHLDMAGKQTPGQIA